MIRNFKVLIILFLIFQTNEIIAKKYDGIVILSSNDTINCKIILPDLHVNYWQDQILSKKKLRVEIDGLRKKISPEDIINYSINFKNQWQTYWSMSTKKGYFFMREIIQGKATLYRCMTYSNINYTFYNHYVIIKPETNEKLFVTEGLLINKKKILDFFHDCEQIQSELKDRKIKTLRFGHDETMVNIYNTKC